MWPPGKNTLSMPYGSVIISAGSATHSVKCWRTSLRTDICSAVLYPSSLLLAMSARKLIINESEKSLGASRFTSSAVKPQGWVLLPDIGNPLKVLSGNVEYIPEPFDFRVYSGFKNINHPFLNTAFHQEAHRLAISEDVRLMFSTISTGYSFEEWGIRLING